MKGVSFKNTAKALFLAALFLFLFIPLVQDLTNIKTYVEPLHGTFYPEPDTDFSQEAWFNGSYQHQKEKFVRDNFGLHHYYIRASGQVKYHLYRKANAAYVVAGYDDYLFETGYIDAYFGKDYLGGKKIDDFISKFKCVQDTLAKHNKLILFVLAPGKATYYSEKIPGKFRTPPARSNYLYIRESLKKQKLPHIDFNRYFLEQKHKSEYPLYPQHGIHWSNYGSIMAFDSISSYVESKLRCDLPDLEIGEVTTSDSLHPPDNDIIKGMNLLWEPRTFPMAYPAFNVRNDTAKHRRPSMLVVGDSFWWHIYSTNIPSATYNNHEFWFYNEAVYPQSFTAPLTVAQTDYYSRIRSFDVIILLYSETSLKRIGDGFVEMAYETLCRNESYREKIQQVKARIAANQSWYDAVAKKAAERGVSVDSMMTLDAIFVLTHPDAK